MGDDTGGKIPGSIMAEVHKVMTVMLPKTTLAQKMTVVEKYGSGSSNSTTRNCGRTTQKWRTYPTKSRTLVKNKLGASLPNMTFPEHKKA
jgi:hypothetical protein